MAQERPSGAFDEVIEVRVVNLEAVVTDRGGDLVRGLGPEDFVLEVDGREVPIEYFAEIDEGRVDEREGVPTVPALAPGEAVPTHYLVFVDEFFALKRDRDQVLEQLGEQLDELRPGDRMAIVAFDGRRLEMLSGWTGDRVALARVIAAARERPSHGAERIVERRRFTSTRTLVNDAVGDSPDPLIRGSVRSRAGLDEEAEVERVVAQMHRVVSAAAATLRGFADPPGRKAMLLFAGGWPYNPAQTAVESPRRAFYNGVPTGDRIYDSLIDTANRLGYTLYPVDVPAVTGSFSDVDDREAPGERRGFELARENQHTLGQLARQTGGRAILNSASDQALERVATDVRSYYWLGFTPTWKGEDEVHKVRLEARGKGHRVRTRRSYADLARSTEVSMMVEGSLLFDNVSSGSSMRAFLGEAKRAGRGKLEVPFRIAIPLHELTFLPTAKGFTAALELRAAVIDDEGDVADVAPIPLDLSAKAVPQGERFSAFESTLTIRKRPHDLVFSLYDRASGKILLNRVRFEPDST